MREVSVLDITKAIENMFIEANYNLPEDVYVALKDGFNVEKSEVGKSILSDIVLNSDIAKKDGVPICQDTGMAVVFLEIGQDVHLVDGDLKSAVNEGVRRAYKNGYLRKSVVEDPIIRNNTMDNTPAIIHIDIVKGDKVNIRISPKGFGSENMSRSKMLKPSDGRDGVIDFIVETVSIAGPNPCPPIVVGVGIGGTIEKAAILAKESLLRGVNLKNSKAHLREMEDIALEKINKLGIGPQGLGGRVTALSVNIESYPTHIAGLPIVVNISCHATRHMETTI